MSPAETNHPLESDKRGKGKQVGECAYICHYWKEEEQDAPPMFAHVGLGKFDTDGKDADREDNPRQFEGDEIFSIVVPPSSRIEYIGTIGA